MITERRIKDALRRLTGRPTRADEQARVVEFLHIGKTAGGQIKHVAKQINRSTNSVFIRGHGHSRTLMRLRDGNRYFFSIREPVSRFRSAFYWCKSGEFHSAPRDLEPDEVAAFSHFPHANDLAEALFDDGERGKHARAAILSIHHCFTSQVDWVRGRGAFLDLRPPVWIIRQERFDDDLKEFMARIGFDGAISLSNDRNQAHRVDNSAEPVISPLGAENLRAWYVQDLHFYRTCCDWLDAGGG